MTKEEAEEYAKTMTFRDAICNLAQAKCIPYRKATFIKIYELLDIIEPKSRSWKADTIIFDEEVFKNFPETAWVTKERIAE